MSLKTDSSIISYPKIETWINREDTCNEQTFEKINGRLEYYIENIGEWHKTKTPEIFGELVSDIKTLEKNLVGRVAKLTEREASKLEPLIQRTRECLQQITDNKNIMYCSTYVHTYNKPLYEEKFNLRRTINTLQLHLFTSDSECVKYYAEKLSHYPEKLKEWKVYHKIPYEFENLEYDLSIYVSVLHGRVENLKKENGESVESLKPIISCAYAALEKVKKDPTLKSNFEYAINFSKSWDLGLAEREFNAVDGLGVVQHCLESQTGASLDLYRMHNFASLFSKSFRNNVVLKTDGIDVELCPEVTGGDQEGVKKYLDGIHTAVNHPTTVKHLTTLDLVKMKIACGFLMANYEKSMVKGVALTNGCFSALTKINQAVNKRLIERGEEVEKAVEDVSVKPAMVKMLHHLEANTYFKAFWKAPEHVKQLQTHLESVDMFNKSLIKTGRLDFEGHEFLGGNDELGLRVYKKSPQDRMSKSEKSEIIVFCTGTENNWEYWNILQDRKVEDFNVLGHKPVLDKAEKAIKKLNKILNVTDKENIKEIKFAGFGLDGAVAQLLAYRVAKDLQKHDTKAFVYCLGTPAYLDRDSAADVDDQENLYSINFALVGDKQLKTNYKLMSLVQNKWSTWSFITYPVYNSNWFFTDFSGHAKDNYFANVEKAIKMPTELYKVYSETDKLLNS